MLIQGNEGARGLCFAGIIALEAIEGSKVEPPAGEMGRMIGG